MPQTLSYPLVNGVRHSFVGIELKLGSAQGLSFPTIGFKSISYTRKRSRAVVEGTNADPLGKTSGMNAYTGECELYLAEWNIFLVQLGPGYGDIVFPVSVTYNAQGMDSVTAWLYGCTIDSSDGGGAKGPDPTVRKFDLAPLKVVMSGIDDNANPLTGVPMGGVQIGVSIGL